MLHLPVSENQQQVTFLLYFYLPLPLALVGSFHHGMVFAHSTAAIASPPGRTRLVLWSFAETVGQQYENVSLYF
jgi:hypothetical protein